MINAYIIALRVADGGVHRKGIVKTPKFLFGILTHLTASP